MAESDNFQVDPAQTINGAEVGTDVDEGESIRDSILASMKEDEGEGADAEDAVAEADEGVSEVEDADDEEAEPVEAEAAEDAEEDETDEDEPAPVEAPVSWSAEDRKIFESLPREAQEVVARRERERDEGTTKRLEEVAPLRNVAQKYEGYLKQLNTTPEAAFDWLMSSEYQLRTGTPEQKAAALQQVAQSYGIPLPSASAPADDDEYVDPQVAALKQEIAELKGQFSSRQQADQESQIAQVEQTVTEFKEAKTEAGAPAHPYFADVESDMVALAQADRAAGKTPQLADLYERACWLNPSIREKLLADKQSGEQRKAVEEKRKRAAAAKKASKSVSSSSGSGAPKVADKEESVRDSIRAARNELAA